MTSPVWTRSASSSISYSKLSCSQLSFTVSLFLPSEKTLHCSHAYLRKRSFSATTVRHYSCGSSALNAIWSKLVNRLSYEFVMKISCIMAEPSCVKIFNLSFVSVIYFLMAVSIVYVFNSETICSIITLPIIGDRVWSFQLFDWGSKNTFLLKSN